MKVGLLVCDHVKEKFLSVNGSYPEMFAKLLPQLDLTVYFACDNQFPEEVNECDAYVVSGSQFSVYDEMDWITRLKEFVREIYAAKLPYVGICFGHQLLGEALGGKVKKVDLGWCVGAHEFRIIKRLSWMEPFVYKANLLMSCQDQIVKLPSNTTVLATSDKCILAMILVGENMLGIQAHPEFSKGYSKALMLDRIERIGMETIDEGIKSLEKELHATEVKSWIEAFLNQVSSPSKS